MFKLRQGNPVGKEVDSSSVKCLPVGILNGSLIIQTVIKQRKHAFKLAFDILNWIVSSQTDYENPQHANKTIKGTVLVPNVLNRLLSHTFD